MKKKIVDLDRLRDRVRLVLKVNYFASFFSIVFFFICYFLLEIRHLLSFIFLIFGLLNLVNTVAHDYHKNLTITYNIVSIMALTGGTIITLYSGGINSPFIFVLALIVFAGYVTTRVYGKIYLNLNLLIVVLIYSQSITEFSFVSNVIPEKSRDLFAFFSILFSVYLLGGVFGKNLLQAHHKLYKTKREIEGQIKEKETLLKEVHHRVKNNLQTVSSLLSLQSRSINDESVKKLIKSSQNRVISMAMVHEMLYMRQDLAKIEYRPYVEELCEYLVGSIKGANSNVKVNIGITDVRIGIDTAIPLGLLINEIVTNALKYAFNEDEGGEIYINIKQEENLEYSLEIGDNGKGFSEEIDFKTTKSLGLKLISNLARQLHGTIKRDTNKPGAHYVLRFKDVEETLH